LCTSEIRVRLSNDGRHSGEEPSWPGRSSLSAASSLSFPRGAALTSHEFERPGYHRPSFGALARAKHHPKLDPRLKAIALSLLVGTATGLALTVSPILAGALAGGAVVLAVAALFDVFGLAVLLTGLLPWLIVLSNVLPRLTLTLASGATAVVLIALAKPTDDGSRSGLLLRLGAALFVVPILFSLAREGMSVGANQAAKFVVFPLMVMIVTEGTNRVDLARLRTVALWSSVAALALNLFLGFTGIANIGYYGTGEILGLGSEHILALLAGCVTAASLASGLTLTWAPVIALGAIATVATGVRSPLPGLALAALVRMVTGRVRFRMMVLVALAVAAIFVSGAAGVVEARFHQGQARGEYQSFRDIGSGRGEIYSAALDGWRASPPFDWVVGSGLTAILRFERERLGQEFVGHSDAIEALVGLGVVGLIGLILIWRVLIERAEVKLPLLVLGSFALFNGVLEYSAPVIIALLLTLRPRPQEALGSEPDSRAIRQRQSGASVAVRTVG
jgi:hypothetical protein